MIKVSIDYRDGSYSLRRHDPPWPNAVEIPDEVWDAYQSFCQQARVWDQFCGSLDRDTYEEQKAGWQAHKDSVKPCAGSS